MSGRFEPDRSGNPRGRRAGSRNKASLLLDRLAEERAKDVLETVIQAAIEGDMKAARILLDRAWPIRRGRPIQIKLPTIETATDASEALKLVIAAAAAGELTPDEAAALADILDRRLKHFEVHELEARLRKLEETER